MNSYTRQLHNKQDKISSDLRAIVNRARAEGDRGLNSDERMRFEKLESDYSSVEHSIKAADRVDGITSDLRGTDPDWLNATMGGQVYGKEAREANRAKHGAVFSKYLRVGTEGLDQDERQFMARQLRGSGAGDIRNAQSITGTGGGYLIPQGFSDALETAMKWYGGILGTCGTFTTESGNPLEWPTVNDTTNKGRILAINTQATETDLTFGQVTFNAWIFTSDSILVPIALIQDSYFDLDQYIAEVLGTRLGRLLNYYLTIGSGSSQPDGIQTAVIAAGNTTQGTTGETTSFSYTDLVDTLHLVDPAYRNVPTAKWMFSDTVLKKARLLVDDNARPLWQPALGAGFGGGFPETILDRPFVINQDMPVPAASAYPILYGDMSKYKVRRVANGTTVLRLVERYADYLQVGYLAFLRADGQLLDAGTHPIAAFQNSAS